MNHFKGDTHKTINVHNYNNDRVVRTRKDSDHSNCNLCSVAREKLQQWPPKAKNAQRNTDIVKICKRCLSEISPGKSHQCWKSNKVGNLAKIAGDGHTKGQFAAATIREQKSESGIVELPNLRGRQTRLNLKAETSENPIPIPHQQMLELKANLNLSVTKVFFQICLFMNKN